ncbi:MAG: hypothetical protein QHJ73_11595 [Armatimonadota bacterium]|nr:hypothetical protein [Armatimonadota bacterium]
MKASCIGGALAALLIAAAGVAGAPGSTRMTQSELIQLTLRETQPLKYPRGSRLPLYLWSALGAGTEDDAETEKILRQLDERGIALIATWRPNDRERSLAEALRVGALQKRLGLHVNVNANACLYSFFNGDEETAHVDEKGQRFFDSSFGETHKMGCPFTLEQRLPIIREQVDFFARAYKQKGIPIHFAFADWEIDGPIEVNGAWEASRRCVRCRAGIPRIDDYPTFQDTIRRMRADLQRRAYVQPILAASPRALVGNYAVYPNDGFRYWYDYFETYTEGTPYKADQRARYRRWNRDEFRLCGYTYAMPVVYTWYPIFGWYDFENPDYRWFYNMLKVGSNAAEHTPASTPIITFVHWHTTSPPPNPDPAVKQFSAEKYQELLWHLLLRGHDAFFLWSPVAEMAEEIRLLHPVYAESLQYRDFLERGVPITFAVPSRQGPVVSGLVLGNRVLVRRTDFDETAGPVAVRVREREILVPRAEGRCQVIPLR